MRTQTLLRVSMMANFEAGKHIHDFADGSREFRRHASAGQLAAKRIMARLNACKITDFGETFGGAQAWYCETHKRCLQVARGETVTHCGGGI